MHAKTAQKHDYPSAAWRRSYARRTGAERGFATAKDPATNDISRGWCRLMGLAPLMLFTTTLLIVRNQRILAAWNARQEENPAPRRQRPAPENPPPPPQDPHRARRHRHAAIDADTSSAGTASTTPQARRAKPAARNPSRSQPAHGTASAQHGQPHQQNVRPGCEDHQGPNVNKAPTKT